jgi:hypothetical protein
MVTPVMLSLLRIIAILENVDLGVIRVIILMVRAVKRTVYRIARITAPNALMDRFVIVRQDAVLV